MKCSNTSHAFRALEICFALILRAAAWQSDNGDGTFKNPPLYADYPDPDIIRVGEDFYFATTTFANSPGLTILHSQDLVNWETVSHVMPGLEGSEKYDLKNGGTFQGEQFAIFCFNPQPGDGFVDVDSFRFTDHKE